MCVAPIGPPRLFLPVSVLPAKSSDVAGQYFGMKELGEGEPTIGDLAQLLSTVRRSDVICLASGAMEALGQAGAVHRTTQIEIANVLLEPGLLQKVLHQTQSLGTWAVFHRRQLWLLVQMAAVVCSETTSSDDRQAMNHRLGRACLMANDVLHQIENEHFSDSKDDDDPLKWLIVVLVAHSDEVTTSDVIARAYCLWFDSASDPVIRKAFAAAELGRDIDDLFKSYYGMSLDEFFFIGFCFYCAFLNSASKRPIQPCLLDGAVPSGGLFSEADKKTTFDILSVPVDRFAARLLGCPRQSWATDYSVLMRSPLIEVFPTKYACPDLSYFRQFFADGIYWRLAEASGKKLKSWQKFFGDLYQWYVNRVIASFTVTSEHLVRTFFPSPKFRGTESEVCDGLIHWTGVSVICEYKGTRLTPRERSGVQLEATIKAIEDGLGSEKVGVGQLAKSLKRILAGAEVVSERTSIDLGTPRKLIPALICYEETSVNYVVRDFLQRKLTDRLHDLGCDSSRVGPLLLFSTTEIELFDRCSGIVSGEDLLTEYVDFVLKSPKDPRSTFRRFVADKFGNRSWPEGFISRKIEELLADFQGRQSTRPSVDTNEPDAG